MHRVKKEAEREGGEEREEGREKERDRKRKDEEAKKTLNASLDRGDFVTTVGNLWTN